MLLRTPELSEVSVELQERNENTEFAFDLIQYTLCNSGYDYREDVRREPEHYALLALLHNNEDFVHALMAVHEMRSALANEKVLKEQPELKGNEDAIMDAAEKILEQDRSFEHESVTMGIYETHSVSNQLMTYRQIAKQIRELFKYKIDPVRLKRVCDYCVDWGWMIRFGNEYGLNLDMIAYSAQNRCLNFDAELYEHKYADALEDMEESDMGELV